MNHQPESITVTYDDRIVRYFVYATLLWGGIAFLAGLLAALQLAYWPMNFSSEFLTFGRLRPLHTNAAIFAFAGNAIFAGIYYSSQRLLKTRMFSDMLSWIHFWGWQIIILAAAITLPLGYSQSKEYAELEWPIDIAITVIWVVFAVNFFGALFRRREKHMYVALWFYIATIVTVALLHIVNSIQIPVAMFQSYPVYAGIQDALVQWWYGHNAVAFFLTTPFLGLMYYFLPKAANRPIYSYRLSIIHFWALVFIYIWAGPHHLLYTALPEWAQTLGMIFSLMLWAPSWGGMINGLLTLKGAWTELIKDPIIKFMVAAITFYGMCTFEGPLLSIKSVSALAHYTDWIVAHVHGGALGWNGMLTFAMIYYLVPFLWKREIYSKKLMDMHFWISFVGIVFYYISMLAAGLTQGLMWRAQKSDGNLLYPEFVETVSSIQPLYWVRAFGGLLFIIGFLIMLWNIFKTVKGAPRHIDDTEVVILKSQIVPKPKESGHRALEGMAGLFTVLTLVAVLVGSVIEIYPTLSLQKYLPKDITAVPYTSLELYGRDIYVKEGCYVCHSQMIRPLVWEALRYGNPSTIEESIFDRPFQWGSKRTGPDLARVGKKYPDLWHYTHMMDPRAVNENSIMPAYPWLVEKKIDYITLRKKLSVMKYLGVPYSDNEVANADLEAKRDAEKISAELIKQGVSPIVTDKEIIALIAYLQALGHKTTSSGSTK
jgi:cytochrome c oxidase cbb3-type subunit I/II